MQNDESLRRRTPRRALAAALCIAAVPALALSACGGADVPDNAVAKVDDATIKRETFDHWLKIAAISSQGPTQGNKAPAVSIPKPPEYTECVAAKKQSAPKPAKGQPAPSDDEFKRQCKLEYEGLRDQVMQLLIQNEWVVQEAEAQDVKVSEAEVQKAFDQQKKQSFPKQADYQRFLKTSGFTEDDIRFRVRLETLSNKLRDKVLKGKDKVTDKEIETYYNKNKQRFAQPERRDLRIVLTKDRAKADQAKSALEGDQTWKAVAKKFSIDQASKGQGGVLLAVAKGQQEPALDKAVFSAKKGELTGPVKTQFGWYVFEVQKVTPKSQQSLDQAKQSIKAILASQGQQKALDEFVKSFQKKWKEKTACAKGYVTADCENAPKKKTGTTAPPGAVPQGEQQPGQAPPGGAAPPEGQAPPGGAAPPEGQAPPGAAPKARRPPAAQPRRRSKDVPGSRLRAAPSMFRPVSEITEALGRLDALTRRLRAECPWDREQDERTIVPHTVEEAYELADAANRGDDAKLLDELGDVLFQVHFLSLLLEERGAGDLGAVAEHCRQKLIRRHPHVFGSVEADSAGEVLHTWDAIKADEAGREPGIFGEVPDNLPGPLYARKVQRRSASSGFDFDQVPFDAVEAELDELREAAASGDRDALFGEVGDVLFAAVNVARKLKVDPELALRASADRFRGRVEGAEALSGGRWEDLTLDEKLSLYAQARLNQA